MSLQESGEMYLESIYVLTKKSDSVRSIDVCEYMGVPGLEDLTYPKYWNLTKRWTEIVRKIKGE